MDSQFNVDWFQGFNIVFNALDNLAARRHVNRMCLAANVPLVESGTTGFNGQVQVIEKVGNSSRSTDCKANTGSFLGENGVLRLQREANTQIISNLHHSHSSHPADPLHCVGEELFIAVRTSNIMSSHWANLLIRELFGTSEETEELDKTENSENGNLSQQTTCARSLLTR